MLSTLPEILLLDCFLVRLLSNLNVHCHIFVAFAGWGLSVFTEYNFWSLVPVLATHAGAIAGAWTYRITVQAHWYQGDIQLDQQDAHVSIQLLY